MACRLKLVRANETSLWAVALLCLLMSGCGYSNADRAKSHRFDAPAALEGIVLGDSAASVKQALIDRKFLLTVSARSQLAKDDPRPAFTVIVLKAHATRERPELQLGFLNDRLVDVRIFADDNRALLAVLLDDARVADSGADILASLSTLHGGRACVWVRHAALAAAQAAWIAKHS